MRRLMLPVLMAVSAVSPFAPVPAHAQWAVIDTAAIARMVDQAKIMTNQLNTLSDISGVASNTLTQLQGFYGSMAQITNAATVIPTLLQSAQTYPLQDLASAEGILRASNSGFTGNLATSALQVLQQTQYFQSSGSYFAATEMNANARSTAGQIAAAQILYQSSQDRIAGLQQMRDQLATAHDPKVTMDLTARAQIENNISQEQANQTAALRMMQEAQAEQATQRQAQADRSSTEALETSLTSAGAE